MRSLLDYNNAGFEFFRCRIVDRQIIFPDRLSLQDWNDTEARAIPGHRNGVYTGVSASLLDVMQDGSGMMVLGCAASVPESFVSLSFVFGPKFPHVLRRASPHTIGVSRFPIVENNARNPHD